MTDIREVEQLQCQLHSQLLNKNFFHLQAERSGSFIQNVALAKPA